MNTKKQILSWRKCVFCVVRAEVEVMFENRAWSNVNLKYRNLCYRLSVFLLRYLEEQLQSCCWDAEISSNVCQNISRFSGNYF